MTALRAWVGAMNPLNEGKVSHIIMLPTIEKMSLQIYEGLSSLIKSRKRSINEPVVTGGIVWIVIGISIASEFADKKAEERTKNVNSTAASIIIEGTNEVSQAKPTVDYIRKNLRSS
jgi:hypothetical protein